MLIKFNKVMFSCEFNILCKGFGVLEFFQVASKYVFGIRFSVLKIYVVTTLRVVESGSP